jgi:phage tail sheath protein FI
MVTVSYPGVYVREVPSGVHTITGVATSIAAFFGRTAKGPVDKAVRILSPSDFTRTFGGPHPASDLAKSVQQFFANGGSDCYVVRLAHEAVAASGTLGNLTGVYNVLTVTAKSEGTWGNGIRLVIDYDTPNPDETFNLRVIYEEGGRAISEERFTSLSMMPASPRFAPLFVSQSSNLINLALHSDVYNNSEDQTSFNDTINGTGVTPPGYSQSRRPFVANIDSGEDDFRDELTGIFASTGCFSISVNGSDYKDIALTGLDVSALDGEDNGAIRTEIADAIADEINGQLPTGSYITCTWDPIGPADSNRYVLRITSADPPYTSVHIRRARQNDLAGPLMLGLDQGGIEVVRYSNMRPRPNGIVFLGNGTLSFTEGIDLLSGLEQDAVTELTINEIPMPLDLTTLTDRTNPLWYEQEDNGTDGMREKLRIIAQAVTDNSDIPWRGEVWGYHLAFIREEGPINGSISFSLSDEDDLAALNSCFIGSPRHYSLRDGNDGSRLEVPDYIGDGEDQTGFHALDSIDLFNLMVLPGDRDVNETQIAQILGPASIYCEQKRAFLLIDAPVSWTRNHRPVAARQDIDGLRRLVVSEYSAVFYPRIEYSDAGIKKTNGPSGLVAGLMARIDSRRGVWKAPAGIEADLRGILGLEVNLTDAENGILNQQGVNCLRQFPSGFVNWGARTLGGSDDIGSEWKYIPVRRLALFLEESLYRGLKWAVFEPNDEPLWAQIRLNVNAFMMSLFRRGAFQGSTPDQAFFVKCDGETTTQDDRNKGIVNVEVGFAPLKPAEFVVITIQQMAGQLG